MNTSLFILVPWHHHPSPSLPPPQLLLPPPLPHPPASLPPLSTQERIQGPALRQAWALAQALWQKENKLIWDAEAKTHARGSIDTILGGH